MVADNLNGLSGPEKSAIVMMAVGEDAAAQLLSHLDDDEIRELSHAMANLGTVSAELVEQAFMEFVRKISSTSSLVGSMYSTERLLERVLPDGRAQAIMEEIRGPAGRTMWDKLGNVNESVLATYLKNEYPQTVAVVLSKIRPEHAARVLGVLPDTFAMEVIMRMLRMEAVQKEVLDDVERTLRTEFMNNLARTSRRDSHEVMADIFNNLDRSTESRFLTQLEERNRDSAEKIKALMFTFEDLQKLDPSSVQTLLRSIQKEQLALALKGASEIVRGLFFDNMSERAGKILREDMEVLGPVRLKDVDEAQMSIVAVSKELAAKGEIMLADNKGEDELVY